MFQNVKSTYILGLILKKYLKKKTYLLLIKNNKSLQKVLNISLNDYKKYSNQIEIDLIPIDKEQLKEGKNILINYDEKDKCFFHIYFNNETKEEDRNFIIKDDNIEKIKIIIDENIKSIKGLFKNCSCLKEINFIKFNRKDFTDMSNIFNGCESLVKLNISKVKTDNVIYMTYMFKNCFYLKDINISNFHIQNVINMSNMFDNCHSLINLDISCFNFSKKINMVYMFSGCSKQLKDAIAKQNDDIKGEAFFEAYSPSLYPND